jgi:ATP-dependent RNA helicase DeaD
VVEPLTEEFDLVDIALAAVRLAAEATRRDGDTDEPDIPEATLFDPSRRESGPRAAGPRGAGPRGGPWRGDVDPRGSTPRGARPSDGGPPRRPRGDGAGWTRLFVGAGRRAGMRPGDLVGAITHEAGIGGSAVGAIQIADGFSIVEVSEDAADRVVEALRGATIRGRKVPVRRDRD